MSFFIDVWRQNLKAEDKTRDWFNQRGTWWLRRKRNEASIGSIHWQATVPDRHPGLEIELTPNDDEPLNLSFGLLLFHLYLSFDARWLRRLVERLTPRHGTFSFHESRSISIRFFDRAIWWLFWMDDSYGSSSDPKWRRGCWHPLDTFLGKQKYSKRVVQPATPVTILMPEGDYDGTIELSVVQWKRPRWFRVKQVRRAEIKVEKPPMFAGKGENSYDQDDDAIYSLTAEAATIDEAVTAYRDAVFRNRQRYGEPMGRQ